MLRLLMEFWPVVMPLLLYAAMQWRRRARARKAGADVPGMLDGPWFWAVVASLGVGALMFLILGLSSDMRRGEYTPPHLENGAVTPGKVTR